MNEQLVLKVLQKIDEHVSQLSKILYVYAALRGYDVLPFLDKDSAEIHAELLELLNRRGEARRR